MASGSYGESFICDSNGVPAVSTATVNAWVAEANRIHRQAAMSFYVSAMSVVTNRTEWYVVESATEFTEMCSYVNNTGGLELYCVDRMTWAAGVHSDTRLAAGDPRRGMAVGSTAQLPTLAHELGHACGLCDLYEYDAGDGLVSEEKTGSLNWSGAAGTGHHSPSLTYRDLTYRCIMNEHHPSVSRADIPLDCLTGMSGSVRVPISVGLLQMVTREPTH